MTAVLIHSAQIFQIISKYCLFHQTYHTIFV
ncbi:Uncharacterised protein [Vibrio cholerae]|nr:Uncharacterised protein [Vibrio cholerae]